MRRPMAVRPRRRRWPRPRHEPPARRQATGRGGLAATALLAASEAAHGARWPLGGHARWRRQRSGLLWFFFYPGGCEGERFQLLPPSARGSTPASRDMNSLGQMADAPVPHGSTLELSPRKPTAREVRACLPPTAEPPAHPPLLRAAGRRRPALSTVGVAQPWAVGAHS